MIDEQYAAKLTDSAALIFFDKLRGALPLREGIYLNARKNNETLPFFSNCLVSFPHYLVKQRSRMPNAERNLDIFARLVVFSSEERDYIKRERKIIKTQYGMTNEALDQNLSRTAVFFLKHVQEQRVFFANDEPSTVRARMLRILEIEKELPVLNYLNLKTWKLRNDFFHGDVDQFATFIATCFQNYLLNEVRGDIAAEDVKRNQYVFVHILQGKSYAEVGKDIGVSQSTAIGIFDRQCERFNKYVIKCVM